MEMTQEDREYTATIINFFWPEQRVSPEGVTDSMVRLASDALSSANTCSDNMDLVPRPTGVKPDLKWALKQIRKIAKRIHENNAGVYFVCKQAIAYSFQGRLQEAKAGLY